jgi:anaerobic selenocysteine-containing dehydrogenase
VELRLSRAEKFGLPPLPDLGDFALPDDRYPLLLTSAKDPHYLHSSYRWVDRLRRKSPRPLARIHPDTGRRFGIRDGQTVSIATAAGRFVQTARFTDRISPGVVLAAHGWWFPEEKGDPLGAWERSGYNMATAACAGKVFGTPILRGIPCSLRPELPDSDADGEN